MAKYNFEFKLEVVTAYLSGKGGYKSLANQFSISNKSTVRKWVKIYEAMGESGLKRRKSHKTYSVQFKLDVLQYKLRTGESYQDVALKFNMHEPSIAANWMRIWNKEGIDGLSKPKGRPPMSKKNKKKKNDNILTREQQLEREIELFRAENAYLKKAPSFRNKYSEPTAKVESRIIHALREDFKLAVILEATGFPKATYMYWQKRFNESNPDEEIEHLIKEIFKENNGNYGYRRICMELRKCGHIVNHKKVLRIMNKLNLKCTKFTRKSRKYNSYKETVGKVAQNRINRRFNTHIPYQKITTDTTEFKYYIKDQSGKTIIKKAYLDPFLDMFNGEILSYRLSQRPNAKAILDALNETIIITKECPYRTTIHTDQGWGYQMKAFRKRLKNNKIFQSMSRRGNCLDNSPMENFFGLMKQEMYYGVIYESFEELKQAVDKYIYYYNNKRVKVKLTGMSPVEYRKQASQLVA